MRIYILKYAHTISDMDQESVRVGAELRAELKKRRISQMAVAQRHGVGQPWISRILNGDAGDRADLVRTLCAEYNVAPPGQRIGDEQAFDRVARDLRELWDGTPAGARRLAALIGAVKACLDQRPADAAAIRGTKAGPSRRERRGRPAG